MMRFVFWQPSLSMHQSAFLSALAAKEDVEVVVIAEHRFSKGREALGWISPDFGKAQTLVSLNRDECAQILKEKNAQSIHIFSSLGSNWFLTHTLMSAMSQNLRCAILAEIPNNRGMTVIARYMRDIVRAAYLDPRLEFFLAIGTNAVRWYESVGFSSEKVYAFGYFLNFPQENITTSVEVPSKPTDAPVEIAYLGRLIPLKGVDVLLRALEHQKHHSWKLNIIGDGPSRSELQKFANTLNLSERIHWHGMQPNAGAMKILQQSDFLVLPSQGDGWGAVVNEALMHGVPVICSDRCGAADLIDGIDRGMVYEANNVKALARTLNQWLSRGKTSNGQRDEIRTWARCISGESAADYFMEIAASYGTRRPHPPWFSDTP